MSTRKPAEVFHPGKQIREEMEERGWTIEELCVKLNWLPVHLRRLIDGCFAVGWRDAVSLARVFGNSDRFWLNLQKAYDDAG